MINRPLDLRFTWRLCLSNLNSTFPNKIRAGLFAAAGCHHPREKSSERGAISSRQQASRASTLAARSRDEKPAITEPLYRAGQEE